MSKRNPKLLKLRKQKRAATPMPRVNNDVDAEIFKKPFRKFDRLKKARVTDYGVRNEIHGGSYAMARKGAFALLEHPVFADARINSRNLRYQGYEMVSTSKGLNFQTKIVQRRPSDEYLCLYGSADIACQLFLLRPTVHDGNLRILETTKSGVRVSLGYPNDLERVNNLLTSGRIKWLRETKQE